MNINILVELVCDDLGITIPEIKYDSKKFNSKTQLASLVIEKNGKKVLYLRKKYNDMITMMFSVCHELRHKYQIDNLIFNFDDYKTSSNLSKREYNMQPEEIDANAYGYLVMIREFGIEIKFNGLDRDIVDMIKNRAKEISKERL